MPPALGGLVKAVFKSSMLTSFLEIDVDCFNDMPMAYKARTRRFFHAVLASMERTEYIYEVKPFVSRGGDYFVVTVRGIMKSYNDKDNMKLGPPEENSLPALKNDPFYSKKHMP